jgi:protein-disulfide isomerase
MEQGSKLTLPVAIIVAGALIAGAVYFSNRDNGGTATADPTATVEQPTLDLDFSDDYVLGDSDALIKLVEYSDLNCHFCQQFHPTVKRIMSEYGSDGRVAWVYRHAAILGPDSTKKAQAAECAGELGGNEKFWQYVDSSFESTDSTPENVAAEIGLDADQFSTCLASGKFSEKVQEQTQGALSAGLQGTPFTLLVNNKGETIPIAGAFPYEEVKTRVDAALENI